MPGRWGVMEQKPVDKMLRTFSTEEAAMTYFNSLGRDYQEEHLVIYGEEKDLRWYIRKVRD